MAARRTAVYSFIFYAHILGDEDSHSTHMHAYLSLCVDETFSNYIAKWRWFQRRGKSFAFVYDGRESKKQPQEWMQHFVIIFRQHFRGWGF